MRIKPNKEQWKAILATIKLLTLQYGSASNLAKALKITPTQVYNWQHKRQAPCMEIALKIEKLTNKIVKRHEICPQYFDGYYSTFQTNKIIEDYT